MEPKAAKRHENSFFSPDRIRAALVWFEKGFVEYKYPQTGL